MQVESAQNLTNNTLISQSIASPTYRDNADAKHRLKQTQVELVAAARDLDGMVKSLESVETSLGVAKGKEIQLIQQMGECKSEAAAAAVGGASALVTFICVLCTLRPQISL
jgi:hypothetical protein